MCQIVVFDGTVGAGKSTQISMLKDELVKRKLRVKITLIKRGHLVVNVWEAILARLLTSNRNDTHPIAALITQRPYLLKSIFRLLVFADTFCIYLKFLFGVYFPKKMGFVVLIEEYIPATIADYLYLGNVIGQQPKKLSFSLDALLRLMQLCRPIKAVFLDASDETLHSRWTRRKSFDEKEEYVHMQRTLIPSLLNLMMPNHFLHLDTTGRSIEETHAMISRFLKVP